jgi:ribbon-helix-helix CopG family protein
MSPSPKKVREQAVVYLSDRDRRLLEELARETGLSRTELFRRGLWALAAQLRAPKRVSAMEMLIAMSDDIEGPTDFSERSDDYVYGGGHPPPRDRGRAVAEPAKESRRPARKRGPGPGARPR